MGIQLSEKTGRYTIPPIAGPNTQLSGTVRLKVDTGWLPEGRLAREVSGAGRKGVPGEWGTSFTVYTPHEIYHNCNTWEDGMGEEEVCM
jgi:hypothetical protein